MASRNPAERHSLGVALFVALFELSVTRRYSARSM
jgi:hypothetical protein